MEGVKPQTWARSRRGNGFHETRAHKNQNGRQQICTAPLTLPKQQVNATRRATILGRLLWRRGGIPLRASKSQTSSTTTRVGDSTECRYLLCVRWTALSIGRVEERKGKGRDGAKLFALEKSRAAPACPTTELSLALHRLMEMWGN